MDSIEELKRQRDLANNLTIRFWFVACAIIFIAEQVFDQRWILPTLLPAMIAILYFFRLRASAKVGDQYEIYSFYRMWAIVLGLSYVSVLVTRALNTAFGDIGIDVDAVITFAPLLFIGFLALYDRFVAKGDAE